MRHWSLRQKMTTLAQWQSNATTVSRGRGFDSPGRLIFIIGIKFGTSVSLNEGFFFLFVAFCVKFHHSA